MSLTHSDPQTYSQRHGDDVLPGDDEQNLDRPCRFCLSLYKAMSLFSVQHAGAVLPFSVGLVHTADIIGAHTVTCINLSFRFGCIIHSFPECLGTLPLCDRGTVFCHSGTNHVESMTTVTTTCSVHLFHAQWKCPFSLEQSPGVCETIWTLASPGLGLTRPEVIPRLF